jgi:tripartite-type tricarboxylate transporter receptor subunit TctC
MTKLPLIVSILAAAVFALPMTAAAEWPERPVHFIVPFPAGGATDVAARVVANGVFVPTGTPQAIAARLNTEVNAALRDEAVRKALADQGQEPVGGTAEAYASFVRAEWEKFGRLVKDLNVTIE